MLRNEWAGPRGRGVQGRLFVASAAAKKAGPRSLLRFTTNDPAPTRNHARCQTSMAVEPKGIEPSTSRMPC